MDDRRTKAENMAEVKVTIIRYIDMAQPIFVEFELEDCNGIKHSFSDKLPVVSPKDDIELPCDGSLGCSIISETTIINGYSSIYINCSTVYHNVSAGI